MSGSNPSRRRVPMVWRIVIGLALGVVVGMILQSGAGDGWHAKTIAALKGTSNFVLGLLRLLATPLIFVAIVTALLRASISGRSGMKLLWFLATNTLVAIVIGLAVANMLRPGAGARLPPPSEAQKAELAAKRKFDPVQDVLLRIIPRSFIDPFRDNEIIPLIAVAIATGVALRRLRHRGGVWTARCEAALAIFELVFEVVLEMLHWVFVLVPVAVFAVVAATIAGHGFGPLVSMGHFVIAVVVALALQACFYLARIRLGSWVRPLPFLRGGSEAFAVAFSTASSTATLPVTYRCATEKIGARASSSSLGVMVGGSINNDGTALYEAMAALFIAQALGLELSLGEQVVVVFMAIVASVGAAGIPEAGLVTMIAVFTAVKLPIEFIPLLLPLDWLLDRCRTTINVMGDLAVTSLLDGRTAQPKQPAPAPAG